MHLCPFEAVTEETLSPFCFSFREYFLTYEHAWDLEKFYYTGCASYPLHCWNFSHWLYIRYGGPLGAVQGVCSIAELIGRLTNSPAHHGLQTNKTLPSSPETSPLIQKMCVDFPHDNLMAAVFAAINLLKQPNGPPNAMKITEDRTWIISKMVPFPGQMTVKSYFVRTARDLFFRSKISTHEVVELDDHGVAESTPITASRWRNM